jgi:hypothetical protein
MPAAPASGRQRPRRAGGGASRRQRLSQDRADALHALGPCSAAPTFSCTWATARNPGSGSVAGLRPQIQPRAPWTSERPSAVSSVRPSAMRSSQRSIAPSSKKSHHGGCGARRRRPAAHPGGSARSKAHRQRRAIQARQPEASATLSVSSSPRSTLSSCSTATMGGPWPSRARSRDRTRSSRTSAACRPPRAPLARR